MPPIILAIALVTQIYAPEGQRRSNTCDITHADYTATGQSAYHLSFSKLKSSKELVSDLVVHVWSSSKAIDLWWFFDSGSIPKVSLISTPDPTAADWTVPPPDGGTRVTGSLTFIGMASGGKIMISAPKSGSRPPKYVIIPEIAEVFSRQSAGAYLPAAFVLKGCKKGGPLPDRLSVTSSPPGHVTE